jgi:hypothetical protein
VRNEGPPPGKSRGPAQDATRGTGGGKAFHPNRARKGPEGHAHMHGEATRVASSRTGWVGVIPPGGWRSHRAGASGVPDALAGVGGRRGRLMPTPRGPASRRRRDRSRRRRESCQRQDERAKPPPGKTKKTSNAVEETRYGTQPPAGPATQKSSRSDKTEPATHPRGKRKPWRNCSEEPDSQPVRQLQAVSADSSAASAAADAGDLSCHSRGRTAASSCNSSSTGLERSSTTRSSPEISSGGSNSLSCPR